jgi:predicted ATP-dependent endonuclease of OLD family
MAKKKEELDYITHVSKAKIGGYKSIESVSIEFEKGLNILIGQNGTGKSNFFEALSFTLIIQDFSKIKIPHSWDIDFITFKKKDINWKKQGHIPNQFIGVTFNQKISINENNVLNSMNLDENDPILLFHGNPHGFWGELDSRKNYLSIYPNHFISFNLPESLEGVEKPLHLNFEISDPFTYSVSSINLIESKLSFDEFSTLFKEKKKLDKTLFHHHFEFNESIKRKVSQVTQIEDFRISNNINIYQNEKRITIKDIILEFKVHGEWMPWSWLSDGTKRLFYIVSEVASQEHGITLIEEPELGIHPHQFHLLMNFLKEESRDKQIIVSTHSPQALDYLDADELSHIIIADYDDKKGTQLRKLNAKEKKDALKFTKEVGYLSDYWLYADLEQRAE